MSGDRQSYRASVPTSEDDLFYLLSEAAIQLANDFIEDPLNEFRGHLTGSQVRNWMSQYRDNPKAAFCSLIYIADRRIVGAFIMTEDKNFLYSTAGKRIEFAFGAKSMDAEMQGMFERENVVLVPINPPQE